MKTGYKVMKEGRVISYLNPAMLTAQLVEELYSLGYVLSGTYR